MKYVLAAILSIGLLSTFCFGGEKPELKDLKDKESYSLGYESGQRLKDQGFDINIEVYISGIRDALGGTKPLLSQEEIHTTVLQLRRRVTAAHRKEFNEQAVKNLSEGKVFMEENKKREGVKTLPSGLQYKVLTEGSGKTPKAGDYVTLHYWGTFIDGTEFDSTYERGEPGTFQVDNVIPGWKEALLLMKEGSKWQLFVPPDLGYGEQGKGRVPPNSTLIFEVELIAVK